MKPKSILVIGLAVLVVAGSAIAATFTPKLKGDAYNPTAADITLGAKAMGGVGEPGFGEHQGFVLVVDPQTAADGASADLTVRSDMLKENPKLTLSSLGFDIFTPGGFDTFDRGSLCGAGLRFDFENADTGGVYSLNCNQGTHTDLGNGWTRVRFTDDEDVTTLAGPTWPGFDTAKVDFIQLLNDGGAGGGVDVLDNIDVNGVLIGKS